MIYLDNSSTTKVTPEVLEAMLPYLVEQYGNPSSLHTLGRKAKQAIETAREQVAKAINAQPKQIYFCSGATEANNWMLSNFQYVLCSRVEHHSVLNNPRCAQLDGDPLEYQICRWNPDLISCMLVNNEIGKIFNIKKMCEIAHSLDVPFHTDATAAFGHILIDVKDLDVDYLSLSGQKFHAPSGVGILYIKNPDKIKPLFYGGSQEANKRAGTENVAGIVAMGKACELYNYNEDTDRYVCKLRNHLSTYIQENIPDVIINEPSRHVSNILSVSFKGLESESVMLLLDREGICVSSGSACNSGSLEPSHVLKEFGVPDDYIYGTIRFSFSELNTMEEIVHVEKVLKNAVKKLRGEK